VLRGTHPAAGADRERDDTSAAVAPAALSTAVVPPTSLEIKDETIGSWARHYPSFRHHRRNLSYE